VDCPICGQTDSTSWAIAHDVEYRTSDDQFDYRRCHQCGVIFLHPIPLARMAEIYPTNYYAYSGGKQSIVHRVKDRVDSRMFRRTLRELPGKRLNVLDVGGGDGWLLTMIRSLDRRVMMTQVVDIDKAAEATARQHGHEYFCGLIEEFESDTRFDLILMLNIIEHVADPGAVLARLRTMMTPDGLILLKTPNTDSLDARLFRHRDWGGYHCPRHWVLFDGETITRVARTAGLRVRRLTYTQGAPFWTVSVLADLARRGAATITSERPAVRHPLFPVLSVAFAAFDLARSKCGARTSQMIVELLPTGEPTPGPQTHPAAR
jgi:2-polyprenyl-3-methyl-5-hydroxy-6-metoxy-1,4-benzoquinol methylase